MKNRLSLIGNVVILLVGIAMIFLNSREKIIESIIILIGILFIVPACISIISVLTNKERGFMPTATVVASAGALALGIALVAVPSFFVSIIVYIFAASLIVISVVDLWRLLAARTVVKFSYAFYIIPAVLLASGIILLSLSIQTIESVIVLIMGIALTAYAINALAEIIFKQRRVATAEAQQATIIDVDEQETKAETDNSANLLP